MSLQSGSDVLVERFDGMSKGPDLAENAIPILHEIRHALTELASTGEPTVIDLSSIPFGPGDLDQLLEILGEGEVQATVNALGVTEIKETAYPGVWLVHHKSQHGDDLTTHIEITQIPSLLRTPDDDVVDSAAALTAKLEQTQAAN